MDRLKPAAWSWLIAAGAALLFIPFLGGVHLFDWDEVNFAECSREMMVKGDFLEIWINYRPFWEKPPFFFWLQVAAMKLFGVNEFAARLPNALCGVLTLVTLFHFGRRLYDVRFGLFWVLAYAGSILPHFYFRSGIIDPWFNFFIFVSLYYLHLFLVRKQNQDASLKWPPWAYLTLAGLVNGMGVLTKGQVAWLIIALCVGVYFVVVARFRWFIKPIEFIWFTLMSAVVSLIWYGFDYALNGPWFITEFLKYQFRLFSTPDAGHAGFPGYHFVVVFFGCFPASLLALRYLLRPRAVGSETPVNAAFARWMLIMFWVVIILFSIVRSKIVHYSSLTYYPLTFLAALAAYNAYKGTWRLPKWLIGLTAGVGGFLSVVLTAVPFVGMNVQKLRPLIADPFAQENLNANVTWYGYEALPGVLLLAGTILAVIAWRRGQMQRGFVAVCVGAGLTIATGLYILPRKIEPYSQGAALAFFEGLRGKDCYVITYGYKSYAHYFYGRPPVPDNPKYYNPDAGAVNNWLLEGDVDKDVYISAKITEVEELRARKELEFLYAKNGFVFFKRGKAQ